jgi:hypothetical protein
MPPTPRYYVPLRRAAQESENETEVQKWLGLVDGFDYSARILIRYCLSQAAKSVVDKAKEWVALAESADLDDTDVPIIRVIISESNLVNTAEESLRKVLQDRLKRLEGFTKIAEELAAHFREQLTELDASKEKS